MRTTGKTGTDDLVLSSAKIEILYSENSRMLLHSCCEMCVMQRMTYSSAHLCNHAGGYIRCCSTSDINVGLLSAVEYAILKQCETADEIEVSERKIR